MTSRSHASRPGFVGSPPRRRGWLAVVLLVWSVVGLAGCGLQASATCAIDVPGLRPGVCPLAPEQRPDAPTMALPVLGQDDETLSLQELRGDVVVVNFWASWCGPCRQEQPALNAVHDRFAAQPVSFVGVDVQEASEVNGLLHEQEFDMPYPSMWDPATKFAGRFDGIGPQTLPATVLVDQQGRVVISLIGITNEIELSELITHLLAES